MKRTSICMEAIEQLRQPDQSSPRRRPGPSVFLALRKSLDLGLRRATDMHYVPFGKISIASPYEKNR
jgi:hypothetical protein